MATIQIVIGEDLLAEADRAAAENAVNRSALFRRALRAYLRELRTRELERRDREGYAKHPDDGLGDWESEAAWPDE